MTNPRNMPALKEDELIADKAIVKEYYHLLDSSLVDYTGLGWSEMTEMRDWLGSLLRQQVEIKIGSQAVSPILGDVTIISSYIRDDGYVRVVVADHAVDSSDGSYVTWTEARSLASREA